MFRLNNGDLLGHQTSQYCHPSLKVLYSKFVQNHHEWADRAHVYELLREIILSIISTEQNCVVKDVL